MDADFRGSEGYCRTEQKFNDFVFKVDDDNYYSSLKWQ
jgi:hypothetical protein